MSASFRAIIACTSICYHKPICSVERSIDSSVKVSLVYNYSRDSFDLFVPLIWT